MATLAARLEHNPTRQADERQGLALTHQRLMLLLLLFIGVTALIVVRLVWLELSTDRAGAAALVDPLTPPRADIVDRNGIPLARTIEAWMIGVHPRRVIGDRAQLARRLHDLIPERSAASFFQLLRPDANFRYIERRALPELVDRVNALGEPGIVFEREPERLYPQTALAGHVLGWVGRDGHGVAGVERSMEARLTDPRLRGTPLSLSIDSRVQATLESELDRAVTAMEAEGGTGIIMDVRSGEVVAMASAPTFNPNDAGSADPSALYNRATMGDYELGSTFKPITVAAAMEAGVITSMAQRYDASAPLVIGRFRIHDDEPLGRALTIPEILVHSSNIASARIADQMGAARMQAAFRALGFDRRAEIELNERSRPLWPSEWGRARVLTSGFGHGIAITPLHLATAYCALVNGGIWRPATLLRVDPGHEAAGRRIYSEATSLRIRQLLRMVVLRGTGRSANVPGFRIGGKTGTAEKVTSHGGYNHHVNVSTFVAAFPMDEPRYVVLVMMDAPKPNAANHFVTTAAYTAAPVVARVIARIGPLIGVIPDEHRDIDVSELMPLLDGGDSEPTAQ